MKHLFTCLFCVASMIGHAAEVPLKGLASATALSISEIRPESLTLQTADDGTTFVAFRLKLENASAVRLYIDGMRLGADDKLYISNPGGTQVLGPYKNAGPSDSGEFWTDAIAGSEVVIELQTGKEGVPDLPFTIVQMESTSVETSAPSTTREPQWRESLYEGMPVKHEVIDGMAVYEGDIILGSVDELAAAVPGKKYSGRSSVGITGSRYRWPNATMPYVIASNAPNVARIESAILHWNTVMAGTVKLVPRTSEANYVKFSLASTSGTCSSYIGMIGYGGQAISLGSSCSVGNVIHEIGHAFGLWHEHTREDRDRYVVINTDNIRSAQVHNFTQNIINGDDIGAYDYNSIMHYGASAFSANGQPTITTVPAGIRIGQRSGLSTGDIAGIRTLYPDSLVIVDPPPPSSTITTTITANPAGTPILVDGVSYTTPASFSWVAGSAHIVSAADRAANGTKSTFVGWSDGGAQTHTITASAATPMFKADYALAYSIAAKAYPAGTTTNNPPSSDGYYPENTSVTVVAKPAAGYCFSNWTGLISGTPDRATLAATRSYDLQANFQPGAITLSAAVMYVKKGGMPRTLGITGTSGCKWTAISTAPWITITSGQTGTGSGVIEFSTGANTTGVNRVGYIEVGGLRVAVNQSGQW